MPRPNAILVILLGLSAAACTQAGAPSATAGPTALPPSIVAATQAALTDAPAATAVPLPAGLAGKWKVELAPGDIATLELGPGFYVIERGDSGRGRLEADGSTLVLSHGTKCAGEGRYAWTITAGALHLQSSTPDACPGRAQSIDGQTFARSG